MSAVPPGKLECGRRNVTPIRGSDRRRQEAVAQIRMEQRELSLQQAHVQDQCRIILRAEGNLEYYLGHQGLIPEDDVKEGVWDAIQYLMSGKK